MLPSLATCRSRVAVLYTIFSLACALALLLLLAEIFNYPLGLKVSASAWSTGRRWIELNAIPCLANVGSDGGMSCTAVGALPS